MGVAVYRAAIRVNGFSVLSPDRLKRMVVSAFRAALKMTDISTVHGSTQNKTDFRHKKTLVHFYNRLEF